MLESPRVAIARRLRWIGLATVLAVALALRFLHLDGGFWMDEMGTYQGAVEPFWQTFSNVAYPLYFVLGRLMLYLGDSEPLLRLPSVAAGIAGIALLYFAGRDIHGRMAGMFAALLLAVNSFHVYYSQEARPYAFVMLFALLLAWMLVRAAERGGAGRWGALGLAAAVALTAHLTLAAWFCAMAAGVGVWLLLGKHALARRERLRRAGALVLAVVIGLSGVMMIIAIHAEPPASLRATPEWLALLARAEGSAEDLDALRKPADATAQRLTSRQYAGYYGSLLPYAVFPGGIALALLFVAGATHVVRQRPALAALLIATHVAVPAVLFLVPVREYPHVRYFSPLLPLTLLVIGCGGGALVDLLRRSMRPSQALALAAVLLLALLTPAVASDLRRAVFVPTRSYWHTDWRGAARDMAERLARDDVVVYLAPPDQLWQIASPLDFYLRREVGEGVVRLQSLHYYPGLLPAVSIRDVLRSHANASIYFLALDRHADQLPHETRVLLDALPLESTSYQGLKLHVLGAPTVNFAPWGAFEPDHVSMPQRPGVAIAGKEKAYAGERALRVHTDQRETLSVTLPFAGSESSAGLALDEATPYTLSFYVRYRGPHRYRRGVRIGLTGKVAAQDAVFDKPILALERTWDWRYFAVPILPGKDTPKGATELALTVALDGPGTVWFDNVQFEPRDHATPFTSALRPSHDQLLTD